LEVLFVPMHYLSVRRVLVVVDFRALPFVIGCDVKFL
jgi:hypothetical protein